MSEISVTFRKGDKIVPELKRVLAWFNLQDKFDIRAIDRSPMRIPVEPGGIALTEEYHRALQDALSAAKALIDIDPSLGDMQVMSEAEKTFVGAVNKAINFPRGV